MATAYWAGGASGATTDTNNAANWVNAANGTNAFGSVPDGNDDVIIQSTANSNVSHNPTQTAAHTFNSIKIEAGGEWTADGSNHLTLNGEDGNDFAFTNNGTYTHANGTVVINNGGGGIDHAAIKNGVGNSTTGFYDLTISGGGTTCEIYGDTTIHRNMEAGGSTTVLRGHLTVTGALSVVGTLNTRFSSTDKNLTVTNGTTVSGTLTCNASTLNLGIAYTNANPSLYISSGGTFNGGTGTHNIGNFQMITSTVTFSTGTTTFSTRNASSYGSFYRNGGTFTHTGGKIVFGDTGNEPRILIKNNTTFYEMEVDGANPLSTFTWGEEYTLTITTNLTIKNGTFDTNNNGAEELDLTVTGDCIVGDGTGSADTAILDGDAGNMSFGSLTIDSDGKYIGTSATTTITTGTIDNDGTLTHNNGTIKIDHDNSINLDLMGSDASVIPVYNLIVDDDSTVGYAACTIENNLTKKGSGRMRPTGDSGRAIEILGTLLIEAGTFGRGGSDTHINTFGSIVLTGGTIDLTGGGGSGKTIVKGAFRNVGGTVNTP